MSGEAVHVSRRTMCSRAGRIFGGCNFQPRYDEETKTPNTPEQIDAMIEAFRAPLQDDEVETLTDYTKTYVGDMCITCGRFSPRF